MMRLSHWVSDNVLPSFIFVVSLGGNLAVSISEFQTVMFREQKSFLLVTRLRFELILPILCVIRSSWSTKSGWKVSRERKTVTKCLHMYSMNCFLPVMLMPFDWKKWTLKKENGIRNADYME